jgi:hypothetical protein
LLLLSWAALIGVSGLAQQIFHKPGKWCFPYPHRLLRGFGKIPFSYETLKHPAFPVYQGSAILQPIEGYFI